MLFSLLVLCFAGLSIAPQVNGGRIAHPSVGTRIPVRTFQSTIVRRLLGAAINRGRLAEESGDGGGESHIARALLQEAEEFFVGGRDAPKDRFPYACSLRVDGTRVHGCGGALIGTKWVLTAAHCVTGSESVGATPIVYVGAYGIEDPASAEVNSLCSLQVIKSVNVFIHEGWTGNAKDGNDIALLLLETEATKTYLRLPHSTHEPGISQIVMGVGWGRTSKHGSLPAVLQLADKLEYVRNSNCQNVWDQVKESMLCAHANSQTPCQGDSGGPLVIPDTEGRFENGNPGFDLLVGLVSFGPDDCGESQKGKIKPGVFTRISFFRGWIDEKMGSTGSEVSGKAAPEPSESPSEGEPEEVSEKAAPEPSESTSEGEPEKVNVTRLQIGSTCEQEEPSTPPPPSPADGDKPSGRNSLIFLKAAIDGDIEVVKQEVENGVDLEAKGSSGATALLYAAQNGHPDILLFLIEKGADIEATDDGGHNALEWGGFFGHIEVLQVLIDQGLNIDESSETGATLVYSAAEGGQLNTLQFFLDNGADVDGRLSRTGATPLVIAGEEGHLAVVEELISRGADVNSKTDDGSTVLITVTRNGERAEVIFALIDAGAEIDGTDLNGNTALHYATYFGRKSNVEALLSRDADTTIVNKKGNTPRDEVCLCFLDKDSSFCDSEQCENGADEIRGLFD
ncbi:hypothetical protein BSKO_04611 [Bryopsis sp. KO-2023]|nr:hypothetical protein BSKO_04611 [Bryopsis sp. KO-2023]